MGHADLIRKIEALPAAQRRAVERLVEALATGQGTEVPVDIDTAIEAARGSWPRKMSIAEIDTTVRAMRDEWREYDR